MTKKSYLNLAKHYLQQGNNKKYQHYLTLAQKENDTTLPENKKNCGATDQPQSDISSNNKLIQLYNQEKYSLLVKLAQKNPDHELLSYLASSIHFSLGNPDLASRAASFIGDPEQRQLRQITAQLWNNLHAPLKNEPRVHLIILCHNREKYVAQALKQLAATDYHNYTVYLADNGSADQTWNIVQETIKYFPDHIQVHTERFPTNIGRPAGHNWLLTKYDHSEAEYIAIGDDDLVEIPTDWLTRMIQTAKAFPKAAVVGGKALNPGQPNVIHGGIRNILTFETNQLSLTNNQDVLDYGQFDYVDKVDHVIGCLHIYNRNILFNTIGLFDIMFSPCQLVDIDHHLRVKLAGYDIIFNGLIKFRHLRAMGKKAGSDKTLAGNSLGNVIKLLNKHNTKQVNQKLDEQHTLRNDWLYDLQFSPPM